MRAAIFETYNGPIEVREIAEPACPRDGVVVAIKACGVCRSDWHAWNGSDSDVTAPHVGGHEFAGVVAEVGPECTRFKVGDRVTAPFILACGTCPDCRHGDATICNSQHVVGFSGFGAFAERLAVPHADFNLVSLPESMDFVTAAGMGCRVTTAFRGLVDRAQVRPGEWLVVHGAGGVGLSAIMIGAALGAQILAIDVNDQALGIAAELGAGTVLNVDGLDRVGERVREITGGGAHVSIDALGITETFHNSIAGLRKMGRHVQIGMPLGRHAEPSLPLLELVYARQISIMGTRGIAASRFPALFDLIGTGKIDPARLVTRRIGLAETGAVIEGMNGYSGHGIVVIDRFEA